MEERMPARKSEIAKPTLSVVSAEEQSPSVDQPGLSDLLVSATKLPNLDDRTSVLANLPRDLYVEGRLDFAEETAPGLPGIRFGQPRSMEYVRCHPDWGAMLHCVRDQRTGNFYPVAIPLMKRQPAIAAAAKLCVVRLAVLEDSDELLLWVCVHPNSSNMPGDRVWRQAQSAAVQHWTKTWWDGHARHYEHPKRPEEFKEPTWPTRTFDEILQTGIADIYMWNEEHSYAQRLLR
jgi:hypothetical protein